MSLAPERNRAQADEHPAGVERDVGDLRAKFDQRDAEIALVLGQAGQRRGDRRGDDRLHAEVRRADDIVDVAQAAPGRRRRRGCRRRAGRHGARSGASRPRPRRSCRAPGARGAPSGRCGRSHCARRRAARRCPICSTWWPPSSTSTLARSLASPPAPKLAQTSSMVSPDMRSASSTASRTACSLASMSVT